MTRRGRQRWRCLDLAPVLPQLRRHRVHTDRREDVFFALAADPPLAGLLPLADPEDAVLVDPEPLLDAQAAYGDVVRLGAGEVVERCAVGVERDDAEIDAKPRAQRDRTTGRARRLDPLGVRVRGEVRHRSFGPLARDEEVDVAHGLASPPVTPRDLQPFDSGGSAHVLEKWAHQLVGVG